MISTTALHRNTNRVTDHIRTIINHVTDHILNMEVGEYAVSNMIGNSPPFALGTLGQLNTTE